MCAMRGSVGGCTVGKIPLEVCVAYCLPPKEFVSLAVRMGLAGEDEYPPSVAACAYNTTEQHA